MTDALLSECRAIPLQPIRSALPSGRFATSRNGWSPSRYWVVSIANARSSEKGIPGSNTEAEIARHVSICIDIQVFPRAYWK